MAWIALAEVPNAAEAAGGLVDKFVGDGLLAVFGAPRRLPQHADAALAEALTRLPPGEAASEVSRALDLPRLKAIMKSPVLVDLRNIYRTDEVAAHGFIYAAVGRPQESGSDNDA